MLTSLRIERQSTQRVQLKVIGKTFLDKEKKMTEVTNSEPVLMFNDKKYIISELHDDAKVIVQMLQGLEQDLVSAKIQHDRLLLAKEGYTSRLEQVIDKDPNEVEAEPVEG